MSHAPNNKSSLSNRHFVSVVITKLLSSNCIEELDQTSYCCNPLTVAKGKNLRLVLDLPHATKYIKQNKFSYENLKLMNHNIKQCGVTPHISTRAKSFEKILKKDKYWQKLLKKILRKD